MKKSGHTFEFLHNKIDYRTVSCPRAGRSNPSQRQVSSILLDLFRYLESPAIKINETNQQTTKPYYQIKYFSTMTASVATINNNNTPAPEPTTASSSTKKASFTMTTTTTETAFDPTDLKYQANEKFWRQGWSCWRRRRHWGWWWWWRWWRLLLLLMVKLLVRAYGETWCCRKWQHKTT